MANVKISELSSGIVPLSGTEEVPVVQGGNTVKTTVQDIANLAAPPTPSLQDVTNVGSTTSNSIIVNNNSVSNFQATGSSGSALIGQDNVSSCGYLVLTNNISAYGVIYCNNLTGPKSYQLPDNNGTMALVEDLFLYKSVVVLSNSDILNMNTNQIIAVPTPPSGKAICVSNITVRTTAGQGFYTSPDILLRPVGGSHALCYTQSQPLSVGNNISSENVNSSWWSDVPSSVALEFRGSQGVPPAGGTLGATVYITYQLIDI